MDLQDFLQNKGMQEVPNPAYKPNSKKNKVSSTIKVPQLTPTLSDGVNMAIVDFNNQYSITKDENDKYSRYGLNYSPYDNMDKALADAQSNFTKIGNALAQTLVSELAIGIPKGFSDLVDFIGQAVGLSDPDYSNPVSSFLEQKQEEFRNFAPIYADPNVSILNGGLLNVGWWASNMPSIISSLTLLVPSMAITKVGKALQLGKAISYGKRYLKPVQKAITKANEVDKLRKAGASAEELAKAGKLTFWENALTSERIRNATNMAIENTTTAALSRTMENYQEARQTYNDVYLQAKDTLKYMSDKDYEKIKQNNASIIEAAGVDPDDRDAVAKAIAKRGADETFKLDYANVIFDVWQLYALRGMFTGKGTNPIRSASVRRAEIDANKYAGKTQQEIAEIKSKLKFKDKAKEWAEDRLYGSKLIIGAELSEGVEEAVNFIAQQEGIHLGGVLTGQIDGKHNRSTLANALSGFDGRIEDYVKAPGLWDSAFWGVLGGVTFQAVGSKAKQISQKLTGKDGLTEAERKQLPWYHLSELRETQAIIDEIHSRQIRMQEYLAKRDKINQNIDIVNSTKDNTVYYESPVEQNLARKRLEEEYADTLALEALRVGNLDSLRAYFSNDNVRKAMIQAGVFDEFDDQGNKINKTDAEKEADSRAYVDRMLKRLDEVEAAYNRELLTVNDIVSSINIRSKRKDQIPAEYIQIMADRNFRRKRAGEIINNAYNNVQAEASRIRTELANNGTIDDMMDYDSMVEIKSLSDELGKLRIELKERLNKKDLELTDRIAVKNIERQIEYIEDRLDKKFSLAALTFAVHRSLRMIKRDDGYYLMDTPESNAFKSELIDNSIVNGTGKYIKFTNTLPMSGTRSSGYKVLTPAEIGQFDTYMSDVDNSIRDLTTNAKSLYDLYVSKTRLKIQKDKLESEITNDYESVNNYAEELHNTMDEARKKAVNDAYKYIRDLYTNKKYAVLDALDAISRNKSIDNIQDLTDEEKANLKSYVDVLAVSDKKNGDIIGSIFDSLKIQDEIEAQIAANTPQQNNPAQPAQPAQPNPTPAPVTNPTPTPAPTPAPSNPAQPTTTPSNPSQSPQTTQPSNPSTQPQNAPQQAQRGQNSGSQNQIDPQNISNRQLTHKQTPKAIKAIDGVDSSNYNNEQVDFYDNEDGTFTVDTSNVEKTFKEDALYENANSIDLLSGTPFIEVYPIVRQKTNGGYEVVSKGRVGININNNTQTQAPAPAPAPTTTNPTQPSTPEPEPQSQSSSTGVVDNQDGAEIGTTSISQDVLASVKSRIGKTLFPEVFGLCKDKKFDEAKTKLEEGKKEYIDELVANGYDRTTAQQIVDEQTKLLTKFITNYEAKQNNLHSSVTELYVSQLNLESATRANETSAVTAYRNAMMSVLNQYAKELGLEEHSGKYYINLEDLLRYVNKITDDSSMATILFNSLREHLNSKEAQEKYVITDANELNNSDFLNNVAKSVEERIKEKEDAALEASIDINRVIREDSDNAESILENIEALNPGDKLEIEIDKTKRVIYFTDTNGNKVGSMPIPFVSNFGRYEITNDDWLYDIRIEDNGEIKSNLFNYFSHLLRQNTDAAKEFVNLALEYANNKKDRSKLVEQLLKNPEFIFAQERYLNTNSSAETALDGLGKLLKYITNVYTIDVIDNPNEKVINKALRLWFTKLNNSYDLAYAIASEQIKPDISVKSILLGDVIRVYDKVNRDDITSLPTPNNAIAGGVNYDIHKIAVISPNNLNTLIVSGGVPLYMKADASSTFVTLPDKNGRMQFVQAYTVKATDSELGVEAKAIYQAIKDEAFKLFRNYNDNPTTENRNKIRNFFNSLLSIRNSNSTMFNGLAFYENNNAFTINIPKTDEIIILATNPRNLQVGNVKLGIGKNKYVSIKSTEFENRLNNLLDNLKFRFSYAYYTSDNNTNLILNGIAKRKNGKFVVEIGDKSWEFNSFNEFVLGQNLVRLNTKPNDKGTSNFNNYFKRDAKASQSFKININVPTDNTSTPVEETPQQTSPQPTRVDVSSKVLDILNSKEDNKGSSIFKTALGTGSTFNIFNEKTLNALDSLDLLPKNIIFDPTFNTREGLEEVNAAYDPKTKQVIVGQKWLDMFNRPTTREEAIRKLIHEQIHHKITEAETDGSNALNKIKSIYKDFKKALNDKAVQDELASKGFDVNHLRVYLFEGNKDALEEFLVESLTSRELADALNNIKAKNFRKFKLNNLFQELLKALADLFGWGVKEGSLYEKELYTIRNSFSKKKETTKKETKKKESKTKKKNDNEPSLFSDDDFNDNQQSQTSQSEVIQPEVTQTPEQVQEQTPIVQQEPEVKPEPVVEQNTDEDKEEVKSTSRKSRLGRDRSRSKLSSVTEYYDEDLEKEYYEKIQRENSSLFEILDNITNQQNEVKEKIKSIEDSIKKITSTKNLDTIYNDIKVKQAKDNNIYLETGESIFGRVSVRIKIDDDYIDSPILFPTKEMLNKENNYNRINNPIKDNYFNILYSLLEYQSLVNNKSTIKSEWTELKSYDNTDETILLYTAFTGNVDPKFEKLARSIDAKGKEHYTPEAALKRVESVLGKGVKFYKIEKQTNYDTKTEEYRLSIDVEGLKKYLDDNYNINVDYTFLNKLTNKSEKIDKETLYIYHKALEEKRKELADLEKMYYEVQPKNNKTAFNPFSTPARDIYDDLPFSSVTEIARNVSSPEAFTRKLPISQQAKFARMIQNGELSTSCR